MTLTLWRVGTAGGRFAAMAVPATPGPPPAAALVVGSLVGEIETELDAVVAAIGDRIRAEIPDFRRLPADTLARAVRGNVTRALRDLRPPTESELEQAAEIGRERAEQGLTVDAVLHAYLAPLGGMGRLGAELETTLRAWFDQEMRVEDTAKALHIHPNTLRHRLRRFEEATGATLRDPRDLVELWWALERRRLAS